MRELPILFSTPMVQAIQAGTKNQTRRTAGLDKVNENPDEWKLVSVSLIHKKLLPGFVYNFDIHFDFMNKKGEETRCKPRYQKDDKIWVKETWCIIPPNYLIFKADCNEQVVKNNKWKSSLFMRKDYARVWLECTDVRCERLQDISEQNAINEGVAIHAVGTPFEGYKEYYIPNMTIGIQPIDSFFSLWMKINGLESLKFNPWVFIYDFKVMKK